MDSGAFDSDGKNKDVVERSGSCTRLKDVDILLDVKEVMGREHEVCEGEMIMKSGGVSLSRKITAVLGNIEYAEKYYDTMLDVEHPNILKTDYIYPKEGGFAYIISYWTPLNLKEYIDSKIDDFFFARPFANAFFLRPTNRMRQLISDLVEGLIYLHKGKKLSHSNLSEFTTRVSHVGGEHYRILLSEMSLVHLDEHGEIEDWLATSMIIENSYECCSRSLNASLSNDTHKFDFDELLNDLRNPQKKKTKAFMKNHPFWLGDEDMYFYVIMYYNNLKCSEKLSAALERLDEKYIGWLQQIDDEIKTDFKVNNGFQYVDATMRDLVKLLGVCVVDFDNFSSPTKSKLKINNVYDVMYYFKNKFPRILVLMHRAACDARIMII